jgi:hypothetical protein
MDFAALQHLPVQRIHWSGGIPHPPSVRLQGLVTLLTVYAPLNLAGPFLCPQRSWALPLRSIHSADRVLLRHPEQCTHLPLHVPLIRFEELDPYGETRRGSWASTPASKPTDRKRRDAPLRSGSLGVLPSRVYRPPTLRPPSETLLSCASDRWAPFRLSDCCTSEYQSIGELEMALAISTLLGFPHRSAPRHLDMHTPGYEFTSPAEKHFCCS